MACLRKQWARVHRTAVPDGAGLRARDNEAIRGPGTHTEWHRVFAWRNLSKFAKTLQKGQLITLEGILRYREVEDEVNGTTFKHRIAEIHAISMKRLSKVETADDPSDGADDE